MSAMLDQQGSNQLQQYGVIDRIHVVPGVGYMQPTGFEQRRSNDIIAAEYLRGIADLREKFTVLSREIEKFKKDATGFIKIHFLPNKHLRIPLDTILEPDEVGYIARTAEIPLYGAGDTPEEAVEMLKREIESLYDDLKEDDQYTEEWLRIKAFLMECIADS